MVNDTYPRRSPGNTHPQTFRRRGFMKEVGSMCFVMILMVFLESQVSVHAFVPEHVAVTRIHRQPSLSSPTSLSSTEQEGILDRFTNPKIDDPALPLTEAGIAQVVAPTLQLIWLSSARSPFPSWTTPIYDITFVPRGAVLAPTLIHGAGLACCWILGCLAVKGYEQEKFEADLPEVVLSTIKAGAFACGLLIMGTQIDLYQEMGGYVQFGDSPETDLRINLALIELINDIFFEATTLLSWRILRSKVNGW
mmetsp:Transcript_34036/g.80128  ORF Transcript_34036/g.80128 Transcript_34036/m.80128 type:complete len:251 (-) Transcript_34036:41-793(-)